MASKEQRMLTAASSKLGTTQLVPLLREEDAWMSLPEEIRGSLYELLPPPEEGEPPNDPDVHPLRTRYKPWIEEEVRRWQEDLSEGRESKKWRGEALQASHDRKNDVFKEYAAQGVFETWDRYPETPKRPESKDGKAEVDSTGEVTTGEYAETKAEESVPRTTETKAEESLELNAEISEETSSKKKRSAPEDGEESPDLLQPSPDLSLESTFKAKTDVTRSINKKQKVDTETTAGGSVDSTAEKSTETNTEATAAEANGTSAEATGDEADAEINVITKSDPNTKIDQNETIKDSEGGHNGGEAAPGH